MYKYTKALLSSLRKTCVALIMQRFLVPVSTVSARNAWHNDLPFVPQNSTKNSGGTSRKIGWGCAARFKKPLPYFRPKSLILPTQFQTWSKIWYPFSDLKPWSPARDRSAWQAVRYGPRQRYGFLAVLVWNRVSTSTILVWNGVWFVHSSLELGMFLRRTSHFFVIWR